VAASAAARPFDLLRPGSTVPFFAACPCSRWHTSTFQQENIVATKSIGIISKPEHAKGLIKALAETDYKPTILGGDPTTLPPSFNVIVCRYKSCSHGASWLASEELRAASRPVIFENGSERVLQCLKEIDAGTYTQAPAPSNLGSVNTPPAPQPKASPKPKKVRVIDALATVIEQGGFYFNKMRERSPSQCIDLMQGVGSIKGRKAAAVTTEALELIEAASPTNVPSLLTQLRKSGKYAEQQLWTEASPRNVSRSLFILASKPLSPQQLGRLAEMSGLFSSKEASLEAAGTNPPKPKRTPPENTKTVKGDRYVADYSKKDEAWIVFALDDAGRKPVDLFHERDEAEAHIAKLEKRAVEETKAEPTFDALQGELHDLLALVADQMRDLELSTYTHGGVEIRMLTVHFNGPGGVACNHPFGQDMQTSTALSKVTCKLCRSSVLFKTAQWALENAQA
jgi:hypothetical protein